MARKLRVTWAPGEQVTAYLAMQGRSERSPAILLAPGAGAGQQHPFMLAVRDGLAAAGHPTMTFDYHYMEAGRRSPDRPARLLEVHTAAADRLATRFGDIAFVGKSMGGRIGSHLAGDKGWPAAGLVYLGYPLVPMGNEQTRPTDHLERIEVPQLFVAGSRDRLGPPGLMREVASRVPDGAIAVIDDADHSLRVPKRAGLSNEEVLAGVVGLLAAWLKRCAG